MNIDIRPQAIAGDPQPVLPPLSAANPIVVREMRTGKPVIRVVRRVAGGPGPLLVRLAGYRLLPVTAVCSVPLWNCVDWPARNW